MYVFINIDVRHYNKTGDMMALSKLKADTFFTLRIRVGVFVEYPN